MFFEHKFLEKDDLGPAFRKKNRGLGDMEMGDTLMFSDVVPRWRGVRRPIPHDIQRVGDRVNIPHHFFQHVLHERTLIVRVRVALLHSVFWTYVNGSNRRYFSRRDGDSSGGDLVRKRHQA